MAAVAHLAGNVDPDKILPRRCLDRSAAAFLRLPPSRVIRTGYSRSYQSRHGIYAHDMLHTTAGIPADGMRATEAPVCLRIGLAK